MPDWRRHVCERLSSLRLSPTREGEIVEGRVRHSASTRKALNSRWFSPQRAFGKFAQAGAHSCETALTASANHIPMSRPPRNIISIVAG
jgi:hypothetical protein